MLILTLKDQPSVPIEAEAITPDRLAGLRLEEVGALKVFLGKRQLRVDELFQVEGDGGNELELRGDLTKVKWIGRAMTCGRITIRGNVGMHLGAHMKGGSIEVHGNAGDWVGGEMSGGFIHIRGNAGGQIGSAYRGSVSGMNRGTIIVEGSAGIEIGMRMKRGVIIVKGPVRDFAGLQMKGGTIFLLGGAEIRTGAWMTRGTIVTLKPIRLQPTFSYSCTYDPAFLRIYARSLANLGVTIPIDTRLGMYQRFVGDSAVPGNGEILTWQPN